MNLRFNSNQTPRGARADAESIDALYLFKNVSQLRLTYQIRLLAFQATDAGKVLEIHVPEDCVVHETLRTYCNSIPNVRIKKV